MRLVLLVSTLFLSVLGRTQEISDKSKSYAHKYLWRQGYFQNFAHKSFDSTSGLYFVKLLGSGKFNDITVKIYLFGDNGDHSYPLILLEKLYRNGTSDYAVIGRNSRLDLMDIVTMKLFFSKYPFPDNVKDKVYEMLISNNIYASYLMPKELNEDSLFIDHKEFR